MNNLLKEIFDTKQFVSARKGTVKIHSETSREQCEFLQSIVSKNKFKSSIEIGLAYGVSAVAIAEAVAANKGEHIVIDKFQDSEWNSIGLELLDRAGLSKQVSFHEEFSYIVLPRLLESGKTIDFAYIDSTKLLDWLLVDFFFLDKMLVNGGIVVFDDVGYLSIRKLLRFISQLPNYKVYAAHPKNVERTLKQRVMSSLRILPGAGRFLKDNLVVSDTELGINAKCVAVQKTGKDTRNWNWHVDF